MQQRGSATPMADDEHRWAVHLSGGEFASEQKLLCPGQPGIEGRRERASENMGQAADGNAVPSVA